MQVLLIAGGWSNERQISLIGAQAIHSALTELGHTVDFFDPALEFSNLWPKAANCDFAFINLHGAPGEDGLIQAMLDKIPCPYQGSGPTASQLALNKAVSKIFFQNQDIPTPNWDIINEANRDKWELKLDFPLFVKPNTGGSSLGVTLVKNQNELGNTLDELFTWSQEVLVESSISGEEITCAVLGQEALPPILIRPAQDAQFFDYDSKYVPEAAEEICPAPISPELTQKIQELALKAHRILDLQGYSRTDFIVEDETPFALEVNTLPGMTPTSLLPQAAQAVGISFKDLISKLIELGLH
mgnify:CR=1 FL=1